MNINKILFSFLFNNLSNLENYSDYENKLDLNIRTNYNDLVFLGNKRTFDTNNKYNLQNLKNLNNLNIFFHEIKKVNKNLFKKNKKDIKQIYFLKENNDIKIKNNNLNNNINETLKNENQIIKYNKVVYINKFLINKKNIKKNAEKKRRSRYRGVSKNGNGWQVIMKFKEKHSYIGTFYSEELAARIYDIISIKRMGINSKTNFFYNNEQILRIVETNFDFKSPSISEIISELIK